MKAIQIETFGRPAEVFKVVDIPDVGAPADGEVVIAVEASPINQYDLLMIAGGYGYRPQLPAIMGTEGVGRVVAVGAGVKHLKEGDRTLVPFLHPNLGRAHQDRRTLVAAVADILDAKVLAFV